MAAYVKHSGPDEFNPPDADTDVALDIFAGRTRIVAQSILTRDCRAHRVPNVSPAPVGPAAHPTTKAVMETRLDLDTDLREGTLSPTLVEYFSSGSARPEFDVGVALWTRGAGESVGKQLLSQRPRMRVVKIHRDHLSILRVCPSSTSVHLRLRILAASPKMTTPSVPTLLSYTQRTTRSGWISYGIYRCLISAQFSSSLFQKLGPCVLLRLRLTAVHGKHD